MLKSLHGCVTQIWSYGLRFFRFPVSGAYENRYSQSISNTFTSRVLFCLVVGVGVHPLPGLPSTSPRIISALNLLHFRDDHGCICFCFLLPTFRTSVSSGLLHPSMKGTKAGWEDNFSRLVVISPFPITEFYFVSCVFLISGRGVL